MITVTAPVATRVHVAVVHGSDMEPHVVLAESRHVLIRRLARYVARRAPCMLWPDDARQVADLLATRDLEGAVTTYFHALGDPGRRVRWERQRVAYRSLSWPENRADRGRRAAQEGGS